MLSKAKIKFIKSLQIKKYRVQEQSFIVQGAKSVQELLNSDFETTMLIGTPSFLLSVTKPGVELIEASEKDLTAISAYETNDTVLAVARIKPNIWPVIPTGEFALVLDDIRDPGNLGTIIRTADWYNIKSIIASAETADLYNPKVISSTMGSFTRIRVYYAGLQEFLSGWQGDVYGTYLNGADVHKAKFENGGLLLIGNESRGISPELEAYVSHKITIPRYGSAESLNAAIATGILCDNVRRNADR